jgi:hypothetical protein
LQISKPAPLSEKQKTLNAINQLKNDPHSGTFMTAQQLKEFLFND